MQTLLEFVAEEKRRLSSQAVPAAIADRWRDRVVANRWHIQDAGAALYLAKYGKGMGFDKAVWLAICASRSGATSFAMRIFERAYEIKYDTKPPRKPAIDFADFVETNRNNVGEKPVPPNIIDQWLEIVKNKWDRSEDGWLDYLLYLQQRQKIIAPDLILIAIIAERRSSRASKFAACMWRKAYEIIYGPQADTSTVQPAQPKKPKGPATRFDLIELE